MHEIEPFHRWLQYYDPADDTDSPFYGKQYNYDLYSETIYGYYINPSWDNIGSETLYVKLLFVDYDQGYAIIEMIGEWNDTLHNDIMHLKRNIIDALLKHNIYQYILIGENIFNFHGSDDSYYEEWFEDVEEEEDFGWIAGVNFPEFIQSEMKQYNIDSYVNLGGKLDVTKWRTMSPHQFFTYVNELISKRLT